MKTPQEDHEPFGLDSVLVVDVLNQISSFWVHEVIKSEHGEASFCKNETMRRRLAWIEIRSRINSLQDRREFPLNFNIKTITK